MGFCGDRATIGEGDDVLYSRGQLSVSAPGCRGSTTFLFWESHLLPLLLSSYDVTYIFILDILSDDLRLQISSKVLFEY